VLRGLAVLAATALTVGLCSSAQAEPPAPVPNDYARLRRTRDRCQSVRIA